MSTPAATVGMQYMHIQRWSDGLWYAWISFDGASWVKLMSASNPTSTNFPTIAKMSINFQPYVNSGAQNTFRQAIDWIRFNFLWLEP
jgi:hypothetical protein